MLFICVCGCAVVLIRGWVGVRISFGLHARSSVQGMEINRKRCVFNVLGPTVKLLGADTISGRFGLGLLRLIQGLGLFRSRGSSPLNQSWLFSHFAWPIRQRKVQSGQQRLAPHSSQLPPTATSLDKAKPPNLPRGSCSIAGSNKLVAV